MPALPTLWGASPLNADDLSRLDFTVDQDTEVLVRDLDNTPADFGTMDTGLPWQAQWATELAAGDDQIGCKFIITDSTDTVLLAGATSALPNLASPNWSDPGWTQIKNRNVNFSLIDVTVSGTFGYTNTTATKAQWDGARIHVFQSINKNKGPDGNRMRIDYVRTNGGTYTAAASGTVEQTGFRIRTGDDQGLNVDAGWAAALNANASIPVIDTEVRIRFQVSAVGAAANFAYEPWVSHNAGAYTLIPNNATPWVAGSADGQKRVMIVPSAQYADGDPTTELLAGSGTFVAGQGRESEPTGTISLASGEDTEIEFCFLIRKWSEDGHVPDGDTFDFRLRKSDGTVLDAYGQTPRITITNRAGHIGGATPETAGNLFVQASNGQLIGIIEVCDISGAGSFNNELVVVVSSDDGDTWEAFDLSNRPGTTLNDVEAADIALDSAAHVAHILWQGPNSNSVYYVQYRGSGHASPNTYITAETVDNATSIPASGAHRGGQGAAIAFRPSDGAAFAFYKDGDGTDDRVSYRKRTSGGTWDASPTDLDGEANVAIQVAFVAVDSNNVIHIIYTGLPGGATDGTIWHRSISTGDVLSARTRVNDVATLITANALNKHVPHAPPRIYNDGATEKIGVVFIDDLEDLYYTESPVSSISFTTDALVTTTSVWTGGGASNAATIALAIDDDADEPVAMWTPNGNRHTIERDVEVAGSWGTDVVEYTGTSGNEIAWISTRIIGSGASQAVGIFTDEHPDAGGTGGMFFRRFSKPSGGAVIRVQNETSQIAEADLAVRALVRLEAETVSVSEAEIRTRFRIKLQDETEQVSEADIPVVGRIRVESETSDISEADLAILGKIKVEGDSLSISEADLSVLGLIRLVNETNNIVELDLTTLQLVRLLNETEQITEQDISVRALVRIELESEDIVESALTVLELVRLISETVQISEAEIHIVAPAGSAIIKVQDETIQISESDLALLGILQLVAEVENISVQDITLLGLTRLANETENISETDITVRDLARIQTETESITEGSITLRALVRLDNRNVQLIETTTPVVGLRRVVGESAQIIEAEIHIVTDVGNLIVKVEDETVQIVESDLKTMDLIRIVDEVLQINEQDIVVRALLRQEDETVQLVENVVSVRNILRFVNEIENLVEADLHFVTDVGSLIIKVQNETINTSEFVLRTRFLVRVHDEVVEINEADITLRDLIRIKSEVSQITEQVLPALSLVRTENVQVQINTGDLAIGGLVKIHDDTVQITEVVLNFTNVLFPIPILVIADVILQTVGTTEVTFTTNGRTQVAITGGDGVSDFYIKQDDTNPSIVCTLIDETGTAVDLTAAISVDIHVRDKDGTVLIDSPATVVDAPNGVIQYDWDAADTAQNGRFYMEFQANWNGGGQTTFPNFKYLILTIRGDLE